MREALSLKITLMRLLMKRIIFVLFLMLTLNSYGNQKPLPVAISFDVAPGKYEKFQATTWQPKDTVCIATTLIKPNNGTSWLPVAGITIAGDKEGEEASIQLIDNRLESKKLSLMYTSLSRGKQQVSLIKGNIAYAQRIVFELQFSGNSTVDIYIDGGVGKLSVPFEVSKLYLGASSARSIVEFNSVPCKTK